MCRLATSLRNQGLAPGTPILVLCENQIEQVVAALAAFAADFIHVPVDTASLSHAEEVQQMVNTVMEFHEPERMVIIANDENTAGKIDEKLNIPPDTMKICCQASRINREWICLQSFFDNPGDPVHPLQPEQAVFFTSGSTALPKGCFIRAAPWFDVLIPSVSLGSTCPGNSVAVPVLMNHAFGFICTILPTVTPRRNRGICELQIQAPGDGGRFATRTLYPRSDGANDGSQLSRNPEPANPSAAGYVRWNGHDTLGY